MDGSGFSYQKINKILPHFPRITHAFRLDLNRRWKGPKSKKE